MAPLTVRLLGGFSVAAAEPVTGLDAGRLQSLLAYLLLHRDVPQQRHRLAYLFWPDTSDAQAHANLRTLVHRLRRALPDADRLIEAGTHTLRWRADAPCTVDVEDFEAAAAEEDSLPLLQRAVSLYRGDLLPGCYDAWIEPERERLRHLFARTLGRAGEHLEAARDYAGARDCAQRRVRHFPLDEEGYRSLMRLRALAGDRAGALDAYRRCVSALAETLGVEPDPATREMYERLLASGAPGAERLSEGQTAEPPLPLLGRDTELRGLQRAWDAARPGAPRLALVTGEAGIGKTRLVEELATWAERQGFDTAWGRAFAVEGGPAYAPIVPWIRAGLRRARKQPPATVCLAEAARLVPEVLVDFPGVSPPVPITDDWQRGQFFDALVRVMLAGSRHLLLLLDDVQWSDGETLAWLHHLLRSAPPARLLVVGTARTHDVGTDANAPLAALLHGLRRDGRLAEIGLGPLDAAQSARLAREAGEPGAIPPPPAHYAAAEGNPLFIVEMVRYRLARRAAGEEPRVDAVQEPVDVALPPTIHALVSARLGQLTPAARELAGCAAVIGRHFSLDVLAAASRLGEQRLARAVDELCRRKIVTARSGERFDFTHEMLREVALAELGPLQRRVLHRRVAQALETSTHEPGRISPALAVHAERAGLTEPAMRHHLATARAAHHLGVTAEAMGSLHRALALFDARGRTTAAERALAVDARELLADLFHLTGRYLEAREAYGIALREAPEPLRRARLYRKTGKTLAGERSYAAALRALRTAEILLDNESEVDPDRRAEWLQLQFDRTSVHYWTGDWGEMEAAHHAIGALLEHHATPQQRRQHAQGMILMRLRRDRYAVSEEMVDLARRSVVESLEEGHVPTVALMRFRLAFVLYLHGALAEAEEQATRALQLTQRTGDGSLAARCLTYLTVIARKQGDVEAVRDRAARSLEAATTMGAVEYVGAARANQAWLHWRQGDHAAARAHARAALAAWEEVPTGSTPFMFQWLALLPLIALELAGPRDAGLDPAVEHARHLLDASQQRLPDDVAVPLDAAVGRWEAGDGQGSRAHLREAVAAAERLGLL